jgi:hypothetical protein
MLQKRLLFENGVDAGFQGGGDSGHREFLSR